MMFKVKKKGRGGGVPSNVMLTVQRIVMLSPFYGVVMSSLLHSEGNRSIFYFAFDNNFISNASFWRKSLLCTSPVSYIMTA